MIVLVVSLVRSTIRRGLCLQEARKQASDASLAEVVASVPAVQRITVRTRRTMRGHLAKIYAMHWSADSKSVAFNQ